MAQFVGRTAEVNKEAGTQLDYVDALRLNSTQFPEVATGKVTPNPPANQRRIPFVRLSDINPTVRGMCEPYVPEFTRSL